MEELSSILGAAGASICLFLFYFKLPLVHGYKRKLENTTTPADAGASNGDSKTLTHNPLLVFYAIVCVSQTIIHYKTALYFISDLTNNYLFV